MEFPSDRKYTEDHEWVRKEGDLWVVGITQYAVEELGDIVYVELPEVGKEVTRKGVVATVESVKAVAEVYTPVGGEVVASNEALVENPQLLQDDPYGEGWIVKLKEKEPPEVGDLMEAQQYAAYVQELRK